jgi:hypothetical protein
MFGGTARSYTWCLTLARGVSEHNEYVVDITLRDTAHTKQVLLILSVSAPPLMSSGSYGGRCWQ